MNPRKINKVKTKSVIAIRFTAAADLKYPLAKWTIERIINTTDKIIMMPRMMPIAINVYGIACAIAGLASG